MKTMKKTAAGIALLATAGLVAGPMAGMSQAWAAETGTITITKVDGNAELSYGAYKIFDADVAADDKVSNVAWAAGAEEAIKPVLVEAGFTGKTAQEAAEFIKTNLGKDGRQAILDSADLGMKIAKAAEGLDSAGSVTPGTAETFDAGYYLFAAKPTASTTASASSPIFAVLGGKAVTVTEKTSVPTLKKQIKEDSKTGDEAWGDTADHTLGQVVEYRLTGTVSANLASFETYKYNFVDTLGAGMSYVADSVEVTIDGEAAPEGSYTVSGLDGQTMRVEFANLKAVEGVTANSSIVVTYKATQSGSAAAIDGIENSAYVEFSHKPGSGDLGKTTEDKAKDYSYALKVVKTDNATDKTLAGAKFTIKNSAGKFIAKTADGKVCEQDTEYKWETGDDGLINVPGIDADTYTIEETDAPADYQLLGKSFTVTIDAAHDAETGKTTISNALGEGTDTKVVLGELGTDQVTDITVKNIKNVGLPITGQSGIALLVLVGGAIVVASSIGIARSRRSDED